MTEPDPADLDALAEAVRSSRKYGAVSVDFVRSLGRRELGKGRRLKEAIKAVKNRLHQVGGACLSRTPRYGEWFASLDRASASGGDALRATCAEIMGVHASTRERLAVLDRFYDVLLSPLPPPRRILDVACGFHPLSIPWMVLSPETEYIAVDIYADLTDFLNRTFPLLGVKGCAMTVDVLGSPLEEEVDAAFLLKSVPGFERIEKGGVRRLLEGLRAGVLFVSFPVRTLGGRQKGMDAHYGEVFGEMIAGTSWDVERFEFPTEVVHRIRK
ncbi:MAG: class I SAM-dependent methyltransferase [Planctomycetota bacterium]|jgi:16S rRNA (guanine(1405)-N(7))-methyltransferase